VYRGAPVGRQRDLRGGVTHRGVRKEPPASRPAGGEQGRPAPWGPAFASIGEQIDDDAGSQLGHGVNRSLGRRNPISRRES
jgi:hypothetical protein